MKLIVAVDQENNIGYKGNLLFHIKDDMKYFRKETLGKTVVMGRKTLESFPGRSPLKDRSNIVLSRDNSYNPDGCTVVHSVDELMSLISGFDSDSVYVIGGAEIYRLLLPYCNTALITKVYKTVQSADKKFPDLGTSWILSEESPLYNDGNLSYKFLKYVKTGDYIE